MLHQFLTVNRLDLIERCRIKVAGRRVPRATDEEMEFGIPLFLDQLTRTLQVEQTEDPMSSRRISGPAGGAAPISSELGESATRHGREMMRHGFTVDQVVHDYGDMCQAITDLAFEQGAPIDNDEFRTLNRCLDNAIADAATEYFYQRELQRDTPDANASNEEFAFFVHELRNHLNTAMLALGAITKGGVGLGGATAKVLERSLVGLRTLIDRSLLDVRLRVGIAHTRQLISVADMIAEIRISSLLAAQARGCAFTVLTVDPSLAVEVDREVLGAAVGNLIQNAFKFTHSGTEVTLSAHAAADRVLIEVRDHCGGLPEGTAEAVFRPFVQGHNDKSGLGIGLSIVRRSVEADHGKLSVQNLPGEGCVFSIDLPRHPLPAPPAPAGPIGPVPS